MNCKNCNREIEPYKPAVIYWCLPCAAALIAREEAARQSGWREAFRAWTPAMREGQIIPIEAAIERAFQAGWSARGLAVSGDPKCNPVGDKPCELGAPLMHGPRPYRWCATHSRLMMQCEMAKVLEKDLHP